MKIVTEMDFVIYKLLQDTDNTYISILNFHLKEFKDSGWNDKDFIKELKKAYNKKHEDFNSIVRQQKEAICSTKILASMEGEDLKKWNEARERAESVSTPIFIGTSYLGHFNKDDYTRVKSRIDEFQLFILRKNHFIEALKTQWKFSLDYPVKQDDVNRLKKQFYEVDERGEFSENERKEYKDLINDIKIEKSQPNSGEKTFKTPNIIIIPNNDSAINDLFDKLKVGNYLDDDYKKTDFNKLFNGTKVGSKFKKLNWKKSRPDLKFFIKKLPVEYWCKDIIENCFLHNNQDLDWKNMSSNIKIKVNNKLIEALFTGNELK